MPSVSVVGGTDGLKFVLKKNKKKKTKRGKTKEKKKKRKKKETLERGPDRSGK